MSNKKIGPKIPFDMLNEPPLMKVGPARPTLEKLLRLASKYELTPQEVWDQRISFVLGNSSFKDINKITREKVEARAIEMYGPRPRQRENERIEAVLKLVVMWYPDIDDTKHKSWIIDQIVRLLTGEEYKHIVAKARVGQEGSTTYNWEVGTAP